jgi:hypothetical protein
VRLLVDAGPLGYLSTAAHGHADALSFVLNIGDREILVDPGTFAYHTDPAWRRYFRGTRAHNTVTVDDQDQSVQAGNFMWTDHARASCLEFEAGATRQRFVGEHNGYGRFDDPVTHRREVVFDGSRQLIEVTDMLRCAGKHDAFRAWHFAENCQVERHGKGLRVISGYTQVLMEPLEELERVELHYAGSATQGGWISRSFGRKAPTMTVLWHSSVAGNTTLRTRITYARSRPGVL